MQNVKGWLTLESKYCTALNPGYIALLCQTVQNTGVITSPNWVLTKLKEFYEIQKNKLEMEKEVCQYKEFQEDGMRKHGTEVFDSLKGYKEIKAVKQLKILQQKSY